MRVQCQNNLRQLGLAANNYHDAHYTFPAAVNGPAKLPPDRRLSWMTLLLPYLEQEPLFKRIENQFGWDTDTNHSAANTLVKVFQCPTQPDGRREDGTGLAHYVGIAGVGADAALLPRDHARAGLFGYERRVTREDVKDGLSSTLLAVETAWANGPWIAGGPPTLRPVQRDERPHLGKGRPFGGLHPTERARFRQPHETNVLLADGSTRCVSDTLNDRTFEAGATIAGDDVFGDFGP